MHRLNAPFMLVVSLVVCASAWVASAADPVPAKDDSTQLKTYSVGGSKTTPKAESTIAPIEKPKFDSGMGFEKPVMDMTPFVVTPVVATPVAPAPAAAAAVTSNTAARSAPKIAVPAPAKPGSSAIPASGNGALPSAPTAPAAARATPPAAGALPQAQTTLPAAPTLALVAIATPAPEYPREAALAGTQGFVVVEFTITTDGSTQDINVIDGNPTRVFDTAARRAVSRWKFQPVLENGTPIQKRVQRRIDFKL